MIVKFSFFMLNLCFEKILGNFTRQNLVNKISTLKKVHSNIQYLFLISALMIPYLTRYISLIATIK